MKHLETVKSRKAREAVIESYTGTLDRASYKSQQYPDKDNIKAMAGLLNAELIYLRKNKEWLFNFSSGGWNSIMAQDKETAIKLAIEEYEYSDTLIVAEDTFRVKTEADYERLDMLLKTI
jgi:hypothetical protein